MSMDLWTAQEREDDRSRAEVRGREHHTCDESISKADNTVSALIAALTDMVDAAPSPEVFDMRAEVDKARALLAALEGKP